MPARAAAVAAANVMLESASSSGAAADAAVAFSDKPRTQGDAALTQPMTKSPRVPMTLLDYCAHSVKKHITVHAAHSTIPEALGSAEARGGNAAVLAMVSCTRSDEHNAPGGMLRAVWPCAPTFSERRIALRRPLGRREPVSDRENYVGAFLELALSRLLPNGLPLDITAHGVLLEGNFKSDSLVLFTNALSGALAQAGLPCEGLFAAVRVVKRGEAGKVRSSLPAKARDGGRELRCLFDRDYSRAALRW
jgi:hypothetical protein